MADPRSTAILAFSRLQRDPKFRGRFPWLHNTVVCIESDLMADVVNNQMAHSFPEGGSIACYYPAEHRMVFVQAVPKDSPRRHPDLPGDDVLNLTAPTTTVGMVIDWISAHDGPAQVSIGRISTANIEKKLALA